MRNTKLKLDAQKTSSGRCGLCEHGLCHLDKHYLHRGAFPSGMEQIIQNGPAVMANDMTSQIMIGPVEYHSIIFHSMTQSVI